MKALRDSAVVHESQPTPATLMLIAPVLEAPVLKNNRKMTENQNCTKQFTFLNILYVSPWNYKAIGTSFEKNTICSNSSLNPEQTDISVQLVKLADLIRDHCKITQSTHENTQG